MVCAGRTFVLRFIFFQRKRVHLTLLSPRIVGSAAGCIVTILLPMTHSSPSQMIGGSLFPREQQIIRCTRLCLTIDIVVSCVGYV